MTLYERINAFAKLSDFLTDLTTQKNTKITQKKLKNELEKFNTTLNKTTIHNPWFTKNFTLTQLNAIAQSTTKKNIENWILPYKNKINKTKQKKIAVIMAGNIPLVGFHDIISTLITGHKIIIKPSSKDKILPKKITQILSIINPEFNKLIKFSEEKITNFDAIIATGSNNSARYFNYYFAKYPNIIRKNRNSIAIITGNENIKTLEQITDDIFIHFGLGCRNIAKIYVPEKYNFNKIFQATQKYKNIIKHNKYANNYTYNRTIYLMNNHKFLDNNFFIIKQQNSIPSPIAVIHFQYYKNTQKLKETIKNNINKIQCIVSEDKNICENTTQPGKTQFPKLNDYEDNINTIDFLLKIP